MPARPRRIVLALLPLIVALGLVLRRLRPGADPSTLQGFISTYAPDTLWGILITMCLAAAFPRWRPLRVTLTALALTTAIELTQLTSVTPLPWLRSFAVPRFLLGTQFAWTDIACLLAAAAISFALLHLIDRAPRRPVHSPHGPDHRATR